MKYCPKCDETHKRWKVGPTAGDSTCQKCGYVKTNIRP